jgi:hypothetical protein
MIIFIDLHKKKEFYKSEIVKLFGISYFSQKKMCNFRQNHSFFV